MIPAQRLSKGRYKCSQCNETFQHRSWLKRHLISHTTEKSYACKICNMTFKRGDSYKRHMKKHTGENLCICNVCHKSFTEKTQIKRHMKVHTTKKPYTCTICNKSFKYPDNYKLHQNRHIGKFNCKTCNKNFSSNSALIKHSKVHLNHKPTVSSKRTRSSQKEVMPNLKKTGTNINEASFTKSGNILSRKENVKIRTQNSNETLLPSGHINQSISNLCCKEYTPQVDTKLPPFHIAFSSKVTIPFPNNTPYSMEAHSKTDSKDECINKSAIGANLFDTGETRGEIVLQTGSFLHHVNSSIGINNQSQTSHNPSLSLISSRMLKTCPTGEWDQRFQNESSQKVYHPNISKHISDTTFSQTHAFSKSAYDLSKASPLKIPMNTCQGSAQYHSDKSFPVTDSFTTTSFKMPHENFHPNYSLQHHLSSSSQIDVSQLSTPFLEHYLQSPGSIDSHVRQKQKIPIKQSQIEETVDLFGKFKLIPKDKVNKRMEK